MTDEDGTLWPRRRLGEFTGGGALGAEKADRVVVIDDHALLAESIAMTLRQSGLDARSVSHDVPDLVGTVLELHPDLVLLDLFLSESPEPSMAAIVSFHRDGIGVLVVTATPNAVLHARCLESGAIGVVEKSAPIERLIEAVHRGLRGQPVMPAAKLIELRKSLDDARRQLARPSPVDALTSKEREVLQAMMRGLSAGRMARDQQVSVVTIRTHIRNVLLKLDVHSQLEAVSMAGREGWFTGRPR